MPDSVLTEKDNEKEVELPLGTQVRIDLPENPTTGYRWNLGDFKSTTLKLRSDEYIPNQPSGIGGGGIRQFLFEARSPGKSKICLKNIRAWEGEDAAVKTFDVTIVTRK
jgi:inhibitor of cysteine peptidase